MKPIFATELIRQMFIWLRGNFSFAPVGSPHNLDTEPQVQSGRELMAKYRETFRALAEWS